MLPATRHLPDLLICATSLLAVLILARWGIQSSSSRVVRCAVAGLAGLACCLLIGSGLLLSNRISAHVPVWWSTWMKGAGIAIGGAAVAFLPVGFVWRNVPGFDPKRRNLLRVARAATFAAPVVLTGFAIIRRNDLRLVENDIWIPALPKDLDGLRLVQLSDIHMSAFLSEADLARAVDMANETKAHLALLTGDLISGPRDPLDTCLKQLARLKSEAGTFGCHGNHEVYAGTSLYTTETGKRLGLDFLRRESRLLRFGAAHLNLAGVDYQRFNRPYLRGTEELLQPGATNLLLSHNPDVFPVAAQQGWDLTLGGHTHGGQVNFEILSASVNIMRFYTPYVYGRYSEGGSSIFVTRGIGTVGVPARLGAPPEVALIRLRTA